MVCCSYGCKGSRLTLCLLLFLFISVFLFISCLLINARWYIHFGLNMTSTYLILVPLFKDHRVWYTIACLFVNNRNLFRDKSSCIFYYFVLSTLVFLINFAALPIPMYIYLSSSLRKRIVSMIIVIMKIFHGIEKNVGTPNYLQM